MTKDNLAFRQELVSLLPRLRRFAIALAGRADVAEDVLQSAIERALRNWTSFERGRRLDSWMFKIMQNYWLDMRRSAAAAPMVSDEGVDIAGEDGRETAETRDQLRATRAAFSALPEEQRAVLTLVVLEGLSYAQAAETIGVPIGTIMSRLARARAAMAARLHHGAVIAPIKKQN